jgi:hypothetical protein
MADQAIPKLTAPAANEAERVRRIQEDARRPISVNLAEGIALSHKLMRFTGSALKGSASPAAMSCCAA